MLNQEQIALLQKLNELTSEMMAILDKKDEELLPQFGLLCLEKWPIMAQFEAWEQVLHFNKTTKKYEVVIPQEDINLLLELNQSIRSMLFAEMQYQLIQAEMKIAELTTKLQNRGYVLTFCNGQYSIEGQ